ncbi:cation:proton antiporter [Streptomyces sp. NPDC048612]|uniref:cation:proton antiporter n=1 Tax=Streptomyces sp. NPDC048612 TaxID=3365579 RepID=UPI00371EE3EE
MSAPDASSLLLALAVLVLVCQAMAGLARRLGQPSVVGEIIGGVLLGPTLFGGRLTDTLFPADIRPLLGAFANIGVALFMFLVGLEFDRRVVRRQAGAMGWLGIGAFVVPFGLGALFAFWLLDAHPSRQPAVFVVFLGTAMAVTAFPVLARIIVDRGLLNSRIGGLALALAAVGDVIAWTVLAVVVAVVGTDGHSWRLLLLLPYAATMVFLVPRLLRSRAVCRLPQRAVVLLVLAGVLASGAATEWMGLHLIFGAFLFGLVVPRTGLPGGFREGLGTSVEPLASFLMPIYFVVAGFRVDLSYLDAAALGELVLILLVASGGKLLGVYGAARAARLDHRSSMGLATLMNVRGLTELVLLTVGLSLGLLDSGLYSLMVVMAVVTTIVSGPLLRASIGAPAEGEDTLGARVPASRPRTEDSGHPPTRQP